MIIKDIARAVLFDPLLLDANELYIVSGYATPTMLSWYIKNLYHKTKTPIKIFLLVGMVPLMASACLCTKASSRSFEVNIRKKLQSWNAATYMMPQLFMATFLSGLKMALQCVHFQDLPILCRALLSADTAKKS